MDEIRKGLVDNLDVSLYANINNSWKEMNYVRMDLLKKKNSLVK